MENKNTMTDDQPETAKLTREIKNLMEEWKKSLPPEMQKRFVEDGFFPNYLRQDKKILFIGRDAYGYAKNAKDGECVNYIDEAQSGWSNKCFYRRMTYNAFGILNGDCTEKDWENMPHCGDIDCFSEDNISFAFMDICKLSSETSGAACDRAQIDRFLKLPETSEFILREIEILNPDIIISANLGDIGAIESAFGNACVEMPADDLAKYNVGNSENLHFYWLTAGKNGRRIPLLDSWHFSAPKKDDFKCFYSPVCEAAKHLLSGRILLALITAVAFLILQKNTVPLPPL